MSDFNRRSFLKTSGAGIIPALLPFSSLLSKEEKSKDTSTKIVKFFGDGEVFEPVEYLSELQKVNAVKPIVKDRYGLGGTVEILEKKFAELTGKEKAIFMPSGTMANELAISILCGDKTKAFVPENSHIYRDEADSAQEVFGKRLMPLGEGKHFFSLDHLKSAMEKIDSDEAFKTGPGMVSIENPVRRADGRAVPIDEIKRISEYCRSKNIKLHLDGARIFIASAWTGVSLKEYASLFDTVYISMYKYFGASGGAILCGSTEIIDKIPLLMKVHGGTLYSNWTNAAMAMNRLEGFEARQKEVVSRSREIISGLNKINGLQISVLDNGTNIHLMKFAKEIDGVKLQDNLAKNHNIKIGKANEQNDLKMTMNETLLYKSVEEIVGAFRKSL
jgi:threonine aldolase